MNVLLIGSGGREHAFAWKIAQSPRCDKLYIAPGNAGTSACGENVAIDPLDFEGISQFALEKKIDLVLVGPEEPLVKGVSDYFMASDTHRHIPVIGPGKAGAQLEGSKDFSKQFMERHGIPTAAYASFTGTGITAALEYLENQPLPIVLKADGLAAGKGVLICETREQARQELEEMLLNAKFGAASEKVVVEQFLEGIELSVFVLTDGNSYKILPEAKDYKRIGEGDTGLNTGGMGSVSPVPFADKEFMEKVEKRIVIPTIEGLKKDGIPYKGFIFVGLMNMDGEPYVIEYNVRMGDPETESVLPRIQSDLLELLQATAENKLEEQELLIDPRQAATVVLVSGGYPGSYEKGKRIGGLDEVENSLLFHAGTSLNEEGHCVTAGGRVLAVTSLSEKAEDALRTSIKNAGSLNFDGKYFRSDIGFDLF
ncbi:phosphoribosylamine--glycine ligase [Anseongella ginsenosidimutans]|uniref:Phosphoribosylamine--glycine ligase n=1 Tax=Anseongella ginsenosidimutans TaxID=496056 RepID=A0A4R3L0P4_9SPHI|nr:phosphoribosylamine--glycine ligase [Anseongella ginsenosidimutans]QEC51343.1 phosphoribosylamine--glycine ligase [Anseongella ginsenosidimutans]TCS89962.1 phosphoribosylamine--glycine ligase [Anseongella ginsenosidimutans]